MATDLHHIINRARVPKVLQEDIPREYMAMLCNTCNLKADTDEIRYVLISRNVNRLGMRVMRESLVRFNAVVMAQGMSELTQFSDILDTIEKEASNANRK